MDDNVVEQPLSIVCKEECNSNALVLWIMMFVSLFITLVVSFHRKRRSFCLSCCDGRPAPAVPLNMLDSYKNRGAYALSFCVIASQLFLVIGNYRFMFGTEVEKMEKGLKYLPQATILICAVLFSQIGYPFFICHTMRNRLVGSITGLSLCILWGSLEVWKRTVISSKCSYKYPTKRSIILRALWDIPLYISLSLLAAKYFYVLVVTVIKREERRRSGEDVSWLASDVIDWKQDYEYTHVKGLLIVNVKRQDFAIDSFGFWDRLHRKIKSKLYRNNPDFKYSTRIVIIYSVSLWVILLETILVVSGVEFRFLGTTHKWEDKLICSLAIAIIIAILFVIVVMLNGVSCYRKHCLMLRRGDRSFLPLSLRNNIENPEHLMYTAFRFAGYQVGFISVGFAVIALMVFLVIFIIMTITLIPQFLVLFKKILLPVFNIVWPLALNILVLSIIERIIVPIIFMIDRERLLINNRRAFHIYSYYMFFITTFSGLMAVGVRILKAMMYGMVFLLQLQRSNFPRRFERNDGGYMAYIGYLLLEHQHANPVLQCFVRLLLETQNKQLSHNEHYMCEGRGDRVYGIQNDSEFISDVINLRKKRIRTRWHMCMLLIKNPSLAKYRSHRLAKKPLVHEEPLYSNIGSYYRDELIHKQFNEVNLIA